MEFHNIAIGNVHCTIDTNVYNEIKLIKNNGMHEFNI